MNTIGKLAAPVSTAGAGAPVSCAVDSSWFMTEPRTRPGRARLFCFPFAGGGASAYFGWDRQVAPELEVWSVQLPGRETQSARPLLTRLAALSDVLVPVLRPHLELPFAFYGHSLGALVAFELTRALRRAGLPAPALCAISARVAPHLAPTTRLHQLDEAAFVEGLRRFGGTPERVLADPDLRRHFLPILRADLALTESYAHEEEAPLAVPIAAFGGESDVSVSAEALRAWQRHTRADFSAEFLPGGHFFIRSDPAAFLRRLGAHLALHLPLGAGG